MPNIKIKSESEITINDYYDRLTNKKILATSALYGPWLPGGEFDWKSYENLVREVIKSGSVPATNVDTTWAIYNDWELTKQMIWRAAEIAAQLESYIEDGRPLLVAGLNTNGHDISADEIAPTIRSQVEEISAGLRERNFERIRYMPVPDKRIYSAPGQTKVAVYREMGQVIGDFTDFGLVFFELDIGIDGFGSNFNANEIEQILTETKQIQEYKSAIITKKPGESYPYDLKSDLVRINIVEAACPDRVQFSTGNDWFIGLARLGKNVDKFGYLLGASQMSPKLFQQWREWVEADNPRALALEHDLQAAAKDFWTPGNVGIYRHYLGIFLAATGLISHPLPHPQCDDRYRVKPEDYFLPLKHAVRLGLAEPSDIKSFVKTGVPGCSDWSDEQIEKQIRWMD